VRLRDRVAIVTGAGKGIGYGIAEEFAKEGARVVIATIEAEGYQAAERIRVTGGDALFVQTDVASQKSIEQMVHIVSDHYGRVDILVNNAGITECIPILDAEIEDWDRLMNIDLRGVFLCSKLVIPYMQKQKSGSIINISSAHALSTLPNYEIYAAAKSGVNGITRAMALSFGAHGIRVNAICPGFTDTPHLRRWLSQYEDPNFAEKEMLELHPVRKIATPTHIAKLAVYLASDESEVMTGAVLSMDGGISAQVYHSKII
jgi:NAD(P)-dependent dehydrogenase (short-subunit alcohol dehydrogenase family)